MNQQFRHLSTNRNWRYHQIKRKRRSALEDNFKNGIKIVVAACLVAVIGYIVIWGIDKMDLRERLSAVRIPFFHKPVSLSMQQLKKNIDSNLFYNLEVSRIQMEFNEKVYTIQTSIDPNLQQTLLTDIDKVTSRNRYKSLYIGIVVMAPETGRILSMVSFDKNNLKHQVSLDNRFPAASIFKIITAAGAVEACQLDASSKLSYHGGKHTLYKPQLQNSESRHTQSVTLEKSFAQSINPVFGKIGINCLGPEKLADFANRFGFEQPFSSVLPIMPSRFHINDETYSWAEIASGFNKDTTLTPIHGAVIGSIAVNGGKSVSPTLVDYVEDDNETKKRRVYRRQIPEPRQVISRRTSDELKKMMLATVTYGTGRKYFRSRSYNKLSKDLTIGGKTGSINVNPRYDWFIGFGENVRNGEAIVVSAMVAHEDYIGKKAGEYAELAVQTYFSHKKN